MFLLYSGQCSKSNNTEDAEIQHIVINGSTAILSEKDGEVTVSWATSDRYFVLTLDGEVDTALQIVKSVEIIN